MSWACNALNHTATKANPGNKSPYEMWYDSPPLAGEVWSFLKPAIYRVKTENKSQPKAQDCYYVGPSVNHPHDYMPVLTTHRIIQTTRNITWQHVPPAPPAPQQHLPPIAEEGGATVGEGAIGKGASSQGGGRVVNLDSESDLDTTGVGPVLPATRKAPAVEAGAGTGGVEEGKSPAPSSPSKRAEIGSINDSSNSSSSSDSSNSKDDSTDKRGSDSNASHTSNGSSSTSGSVSSGDIPSLTGAEARHLQHFGKPPELQSGRTRSQSRGWTLSESCTDALLAYAKTEAKEAEETEQAHDLLLEERLEEEREWLDELQGLFEGRGLRVKQREEEQGSDCSLAMAAEPQSELSIPSPIGKKPNEVESSPHSFTRVKRSGYRKGWEEVIQSELDGHMKTGTFHMADRVPEGRKPVSSRCFDYKTDKEGKITKFKVRLVARGFTQIRDVDYTHSPSPCPCSSSIKLVLAVANA